MIACYTCGKESNQRSEGGVPYCSKCKFTHAAPKEEKADFWPKPPVTLRSGATPKGLLPDDCYRCHPIKPRADRDRGVLCLHCYARQSF